jgi:hypothetical protein
MTKHDNEHATEHEREFQRENQRHDKYRGLHKDWRAWAVVLVMLVGIVAYILSFDEADSPNAPAGGLRVPAAAG